MLKIRLPCNIAKITMTPARDILDYKPHIIPGIFFNRYIALLGFIKGSFSFLEFCTLFFLSGRSRTKEVSVKRDAFRLAYWKQDIHEFLNEDGSINLFGSRFYTTSENYGELMTLLQEMMVCDEYATQQFMKDGDVVIDAGANIGMFSVKATHDFPTAHLYAFEPSARTFDVLKKNTAHYPNITRINLGLGESENQKTITQYEFGAVGARMEDSSMGTLASPWEKTFSETASITTIDSFVKKGNLPRVNFIKIDTEGYEAKILRGAAETIRKYRPVMAMSAYHHPGDKEALPALLKSICPDYLYEFKNSGSEILICHVPAQ
jgi:FkbM family methyltransferase